MARLTVWLTICGLVGLTSFVKGPRRVPLDVVRSSVIGLLMGTVVYYFLAIALLLTE